MLNEARMDGIAEPDTLSLAGSAPLRESSLVMRLRLEKIDSPQHEEARSSLAPVHSFF